MEKKKTEKLLVPLTLLSVPSSEPNTAICSVAHLGLPVSPSWGHCMYFIALCPLQKEQETLLLVVGTLAVWVVQTKEILDGPDQMILTHS